MKSICVLLPSSIKNDARVIKTVQTLSIEHTVHLYYVDANEDNYTIFNTNVTLFRIAPQPNTFLKKLVSHSVFYRGFNFLISAVISKESTYDVIFANDLPTLMPAAKLAKHFKAKLVYDSHEIYCETLNQFFPSNPGFVKRIFYDLALRFMRFSGSKMEGKLLKQVDEFITVNESILDYFKSKHTVKRGTVIMNLPQKSDTDPLQVDFRKTYNWAESDVVFMYQGVLNHGRGLELIIDSLAASESDNKLIIAGHGSLYDSLVKKVKNLKATSRIKFIGRIPLNELPAYTQAADIGFNLLEDLNLSKKLASPNKLFEYIHAGIPVICSNSLENARVLQQFNVGVLVENQQNAVLEGMRSIKATLKLEDYAFDLKKGAAHYTWEKQIPDLLNTIER